MYIPTCSRGFVVALISAALSGGLAGCSVEDQSAPSFTGPSEFALSVTLTATPDQLPRDGSSQSTITVFVRDAQGRPASGQRLSVTSSIGTVSQSAIVTNADGRATITLTAPGSGAVGNAAIVRVIPVGGDASTATVRSVTILLTGPSNSTAPEPRFTPTPDAPERLQRVSFDASATRDENAVCGDACTYFWNFDGEATATGRIVSYAFQQARSYAVTLTVRDASGTSASTVRTITVTNPGAPTASFTSSPTAPAAKQPVLFNGSASTAAAGHTIASYRWEFGDGDTTTTTSPTTTHAYANAGSYAVTLTVTDDVGQQRSTTTTIAIGAGITPAFTTSPTNPRPGETVFLNASSSTTTPGATITSYSWDFGNGVTETTTDPRTSTSYAAVRTYTIRLTVTDSAGRTATTTATITVSAS